jgi:hypothetical protein
MKLVVAFLVVVTAFASHSCATSEGYNTQRGAAIGAVGGALAGQAIGRNTGGTLIGAAVGALAGAIAGNAVDQNEAQKRQQQGGAVVMSAPAPDAPPPGRWIEVTGRWVGGKWVPTHREWVPINP